VTNTSGNSDDKPERLIRAAQYVRMSTEHQKYSTENQAEIIAEYAAHRGFEIVRTYEDSGKSGLKLDGRLSLQKLIADEAHERAGPALGEPKRQRRMAEARYFASRWKGAPRARRRKIADRCHCRAGTFVGLSPSRRPGAASCRW